MWSSIEFREMQGLVSRKQVVSKEKNIDLIKWDQTSILMKFGVLILKNINMLGPMGGAVS